MELVMPIILVMALVGSVLVTYCDEEMWDDWIIRIQWNSYVDSYNSVKWNNVKWNKGQLMNKSDWYEELKQDAYDEAKQEAIEEHEIRNDLDYALDKLGMHDVHQEIVDLRNRLNEYGHEFSTDEVIDMLKEI